MATSDNLELQSELTTRNRQIAAVHTIAQLLSSTLDLDDRLRDILTVSMEAVESVAGSIMLYKPSIECLVFQCVVGPSAENLTGYSMKASEGVAGQVFLTGKPLITNRPAEVPDHRPEVGERIGFHTDSIVTVPLQHRTGKPVGVMQILNKRTGDFNDDDLEVLEIVAAVAAAAIENARLAREAQFAAVAHAVGDLSHDIKNKVTPVSLSVDTLMPMMDDMFTDLDALDENSTPGDVRAATDTIRGFYAETFQIIKDQVREIQDYTKLIADALKGSISEPQLLPNNLHEAIEPQLASLDAVARSRSVQIVRNYGDIPVFSFDRFLIERAVYNLVNNAIPETPAGGTVTVITSLDGKGNVSIEVRDTGRGMPPNMLKRILSGEAKSTKPGGTGLGTRIVFNAVAAHNGSFEGESREGEGTVLRLILPLH